MIRGCVYWLLLAGILTLAVAGVLVFIRRPGSAPDTTEILIWTAAGVLALGTCGCFCNDVRRGKIKCRSGRTAPRHRPLTDSEGFSETTPIVHAPGYESLLDATL